MGPHVCEELLRVEVVLHSSRRDLVGSKEHMVPVNEVLNVLRSLAQISDLVD